LSAGLLWKAYDWIRDGIIEKDNLQTLLSNSVVREERTKGELNTLRETTAIKDQHRKNIEALVETHEVEMTAIREETNAAKSVLEDRERLQRVSASRNTLLTKLSNRASEKVFNEIADTFNN
jgi:predicted type IV restriction endonuclease